MPKSKLLWADILILVVIIPFIVLWVMAGIGWAFAMFAMVTILLILTLRNSRIKKERDYEYEDSDEELYIIERRRTPPETSIDRARKW